MNKKVFTVTQINNYVKKIFMYDPLLNNIWIKGEISNLKIHGSGHIYFTLKDDGGAISSVMFKSNASKLIFDIENGMEVIAFGYISLYEKTGQYQFYTQSIEPDGQGALYKAFEQLKTRLSEEGLFNDEYKKPIPKYPTKVGIITSATGAAIKDIINVATRRNPTVQLYLKPVLVQGIDAANSISNAIIEFNEKYDVDLLIVGRGGGSIEDLWAFNEEIVARAIFQSTIPIISAVGHETDFTISDFVSDMRAPTPSAAAELAIPSITELNETINNYRFRLKTNLDTILIKKREKLSFLTNHPVFKTPMIQIDQYKQTLDHLTKDLNLAIDRSLDQKKLLLKAYIEKLSLLSPNNNLQRGYTIILDKEDNNIDSVNKIKEGQTVKIKFKDGYAIASIVKKELDL